MVTEFQNELLYTKTAFKQQEDGVWTFADWTGDSTSDLVYIQTRNTAKGKVEVSIASNESGYQEIAFKGETALDVDENAVWLVGDVEGTERPDLVYVKDRETGTGFVQLRVASSSSNFTSIILDVQTAHPEKDGSGYWAVADTTGSGLLDLCYIKVRNTESGKVELWIAGAASGYAAISREGATAFDAEDNGVWDMIDTTGSGRADLVYIKTSNTQSGKVELYIASAISNYKEQSYSCITKYAQDTGATWTMAKYKPDTAPSLVYIDNKDTKSQKVELHVSSTWVTKAFESFAATSRKIRLDGSVLYAECQKINGEWIESSFDLNLVVGNIDGHFVWGKAKFADSAEYLDLSGTMLSAQLRDSATGKLKPSSFDLGPKLKNDDGLLKLTQVPVLMGVTDADMQVVLDALQARMERDVDFKLSVCEVNEGTTIFYVNATAELEVGFVFQTFTAEARASIYHLSKTTGTPMEQVSVDFFTVEAGIKAGNTGLFIGAQLNLVDMQAGAFELTLGLGVETGAGFSEDGFEAEFLGCGLVIGKKIEISVFGNSFGVNLETIWNSIF